MNEACPYLVNTVVLLSYCLAANHACYREFMMERLCESWRYMKIYSLLIASYIRQKLFGGIFLLCCADIIMKENCFMPRYLRLNTGMHVSCDMFRATSI